jgi:prepilin-type N-terminal cleavage/methylation domain-containing protein
VDLHLTWGRRNRPPARGLLGVDHSRPTAGPMRRSEAEAAFTMPELIVAIALAATFFAAIYTALAFGFDWMRITRENLRATQILEQKMETIRLYTWDQVTNTGFIATNFVDVFCPVTNASPGLTYTGTVSIAQSDVGESYSNDLCRVTVQLDWKSGRVVRSRQMQTFVAKNGLQNYIY